MDDSDDQAWTPQDRSAAAAEYVMGTLPPGERRAMRVAVAADEALLADVHAWERHFGALNASITPTAPPPSLWDRIERSLPADGPGETAPAVATAATPVPANDNLRRSRNRWRFAALAAAVAAGLFGVIAVQETPGGASGIGQRVAGLFGLGHPAVAPRADAFVAVVNADGGAQPSLVVSVDAATGGVQVRSLGVDRPDGRSLEVWHVPQGGEPLSAGLVGEGTITLDKAPPRRGDTLAISLEPQGGAPDGVATGPVIYTGKLVEAPIQ